MITRRPLVAAIAGRSSCSCCSPCRSPRCASASPTTATTTPGSTTRVGLRPARRGLRPRLQRPARPGRHDASRRLAARHARRGSSSPRRRTPTSPSSPRAALAGRRRRGPERDPEELAPGRAHHATLVDRLRDDVLPGATRGSPVQRLRRRRHGDAPGPGRQDRRPAPDLHRLGRRAQRAAPDGGLPLPVGAARLRRVQPALDRRGLRRGGARLPDGVGASLLGVDGEVPIVSFVPLFMFAILFGLSMDYNVFLQSRIREEYLRGAAREESRRRAWRASARSSSPPA